jgi:hypothetical protein
MTDDFSESEARVTCPNCEKSLPFPKMNVCYIARLDCPNCGASILIEGDKITAETPSTGS